jgi:hypothetical protein
MVKEHNPWDKLPTPLYCAHGQFNLPTHLICRYGKFTYLTKTTCELISMGMNSSGYMGSHPYFTNVEHLERKKSTSFQRLRI